MAVDGLDDAREHQQELQVVVRRLAGIEQILAEVARDGPVVMLAGAVDTGEGLLVQQAHKAVLRGDALHRLHHELVLVDGDVAGAVDRRALVLGRGDLVVLGRRGDAHLPELLVQILHERADALPDDAEILIVQLLPLGRGRAEQGAAGIDEVAALEILFTVYNKVLLLRADGRDHTLGLRVAEQVQNADGLLAQRLHGTQQRGLVIERLAGIGHKDRRDAQDRTAGHFLHEGRGRHVPGRIAAGIMCGAQTAGGEGGRIRLAHDELLARQVQDLLAVLVRRGEKRIVLLRRDARERLEPVGVVRGALLNGPFHHGLGHDIRRGHGDLTAVLDHAHDLRIDLLRQTLLHDGSAEYIFPKIFGYLHWNSSLSDSCRSL